MKRARVVLILALSIVIGGRIPAAMACSCVASTPEQNFKQASHVFVGVAVDSEAPASKDGVVSSGDPVRWTFDVEDVEKGKVKDPTVVTTPRDGATCGASFVEGNRYRVFVYEDDAGRHHTSLCSGNEDLGPAAGGGYDPKVIEEPSREPPERGPDEPVSSEEEPTKAPDEEPRELPSPDDGREPGAPELAADTVATTDDGRGVAIALGILGLIGAGSATALTVARRRARA